MMNPEIAAFIEGLDKPWQAELCNRLCALVHEMIADAEERMQYRKPHFLKNGKYAAVITPAKEHVGFTIFNAADVDMPADLFDGPPERKTIKIREGQGVDFEQVGRLLGQASGTL